MTARLPSSAAASARISVTTLAKAEILAMSLWLVSTAPLPEMRAEVVLSGGQVAALATAASAATVMLAADHPGQIGLRALTGVSRGAGRAAGGRADAGFGGPPSDRPWRAARLARGGADTDRVVGAASLSHAGPVAGRSGAGLARPEASAGLCRLLWPYVGALCLLDVDRERSGAVAAGRRGAANRLCRHRPERVGLPARRRPCRPNRQGRSRAGRNAGFGLCRRGDSGEPWRAAYVDHSRSAAFGDGSLIPDSAQFWRWWPMLPRPSEWVV